jgi:hypothetical protein
VGNCAGAVCCVASGSACLNGSDCCSGNCNLFTCG